MARNEKLTAPSCASADNDASIAIARIVTTIAMCLRILLNIETPFVTVRLPLRIIRTNDERLDDNHAFLVGIGRNRPENGSYFCRRDPEGLLVQSLVIFPRVHVARNVGRLNRNAPHLFSVRIEQRAQTSLRIEGQQFITVSEID